MGEGPFQQGQLAAGLELLPDTKKHGVVRPEKSVPLVAYESDLAATRTSWQVDET
jgi:hypothetical protein